MESPVIHALLRPALSLSKKGSSIHNKPARPQARIPSTSPSTNQTLEGMSLRVWNMKRKYHSGLMPAGAEIKGSAFTLRFHGKMAASAPSTPMATYQAIISRSAKFGKNFISRREEGFAAHSASTLGGTLMPW